MLARSRIRLNLAIAFATILFIAGCMTVSVMADEENSNQAVNSGTETVSDENSSSEQLGSEAENDRYLEDGEYVISSSKDGFKVVDHSNNGNVQVGEADGRQSQRYNFSYRKGEAGGYYTIGTPDGKYLSVENQNKNSGANAILDNLHDEALWQRWALIPYDNGLFGIKSLFSGMMLDLKNGSTAAGNNIWLYSENETPAQMFSFYKAAENADIQDGAYTIISGLDSGKVIDQSGAGTGDKVNVQIYESNGTAAQKWILQKASGNTYRIYSVNSGKVIDVANGSMRSGANVWSYSSNNTKAQLWKIRNFGDGSVYFTSVLNGKNLDVAGAKTANGTNLWVYDSNGTNAQRFFLNKLDYRPVDDGAYIIRNNRNHRMVVDIDGANRQVAANAQLYTGNGTAAQIFKFTQGKDGFYTITNVNSRHVLDVANASKSNGANIRQYSANGTNAQKWLVRLNADGSITLINAASSKVLDITNGALRNSANIQQYAFNGTQAQKFILSPTTYDKALDSKPIDYSVYDPFRARIAATARSLGNSLWNAYNWVAGFRRYYLTSNGRTSWPIMSSRDYAIYGLNHRGGDCIVMASTLRYIAQYLGYNAIQRFGYVGSATHSWVEINGKVYDANFKNETGRNGFGISYGQRGTWKYRIVKNI